MRKSIILLSALILISSSCSPKMKSIIVSERPPLAYDSDVYVLTEDESVPNGAEALGKLKIGDTGFTVKCSYETVLEQARLQARENGANIVKITDHKTPSAMGSSCHRIKADYYYIADASALENNGEEPILADVDYALLYVYRYPGAGAMVSYNLQLGDSTLCRVKNSYKEVVHIKKEGLNSLWAKTESKVEVPIDVIYGRSYYLRCGIKMGALVGRPSLELVDYKTGKAEFESFKAKNTSPDEGE